MRMAVRDIQPVQAAYIRDFNGTRSTERIAGHFSQLNRLATRRELWRSDTVLIGIPMYPWYLTPSDHSYYDACLTLKPDAEYPPEANVRTLAGGLHAVIRLEEPELIVRELMVACLTGWLPKSGYVFDNRPTMMITYNNPTTDPNGKSIVDFCLPIRSID